jgi:hypothetical protein
MGNAERKNGGGGCPINRYAGENAGNGFTIQGLSNVTLVGGEAESSGQDGVYADFYEGNPAYGTIGMTITGLDIEHNMGSGIHTNEASGTSISGSSIINNAMDGLRISGGIGLVMTGGRLGNNGGYGINVAVTSSRGYPSQDIAVFAPLAQYPGNSKGFVNDPYHQVLYYSAATIGVGGVTWSTGSVLPSTPCATGSIYTNTSGNPNSTLYVCEAGTWAPK